ncbi:MAG TPA: hypothetical protein VF010_16095 [Methylomirabilota bacterium]|nr:hypothetical protein [Methylomirabilota bacterium]
MQFLVRCTTFAVAAALIAGPALAQSIGTTTTPPTALPGGTPGLGGTAGTSGNVLRPADPSVPRSTNQSTPSTPNTGIGGSTTGGIPGTLGGTRYSTGGSVTGGIPGTLGGTPSGGASSQSNTSIGGAGTSTTLTAPSTLGGSTTGSTGTGIPPTGGSTTGAIGGSSLGGPTGRTR